MSLWIAEAAERGLVPARIGIEARRGEKIVLKVSPDLPERRGDSERREEGGEGRSREG